jgi:hypothetical protein
MHSVPIAQVWPAAVASPPMYQPPMPTTMSPRVVNQGLVGSRGSFGVLPTDLSLDDMALVHMFLGCFVMLVFICLYMAVQSMRMTAQLTMSHQLMVQIAMMLAQQLQQQRR